MNPTDASWDRFVKSHPRRAAEHAPHYRNAEQREAVLRALDRAKRCRRCGRKLRDPESVAAKLGPECRTRAVAR